MQTSTRQHLLRAQSRPRPRRPRQVAEANSSVERDRPQAALVGSLRGFAATATPHVKR
jgi:hypothetical protein